MSTSPLLELVEGVGKCSLIGRYQHLNDSEFCRKVHTVDEHARTTGRLPDQSQEGPYLRGQLCRDHAADAERPEEAIHDQVRC